MISLYASGLRAGGSVSGPPFVARVTTSEAIPASIRPDHFLISPVGVISAPEGFRGYGVFDSADVASNLPADHLIIPEALAHLGNGDVIRVDPERRTIRVLYRRTSSHNALLLTERCNSFCLMCSQPPREVNDDYILDDVIKALPLISTDTREIGLTGGEPTLYGEKFVNLVRLFKNYLPRTSLHVLSNGRNFSDRALAAAVGQVGHPDVMFGIPLYSDLSDVHDFVVQADGAYDETIRGILNLKAAKVRVEIRVVIHKQTYARLPHLARFIARNLTFVDQVALMGLEMTGFTKANLGALWIDPCNYQNELGEAIEELDRFRIRASIYNHQLCLIPQHLQQFAVKSISDWKNEYMPECQGCLRMNECGGFFSSATLRYSKNIKPFKNLVGTP